MNQPSLFDERPRFFGCTLEASDIPRLESQQERVTAVMKDGVWRSLNRISSLTGDPESSISARLRSARQAQHGGWTVERRRVGRGLWEYRFVRS